LVALDARSGNLLWQAKLAEASDGYWCPVAPLAVKDKIVVGIAPGDDGLNGFLDAYDAETGKRVWRWEAIPGPASAAAKRGRATRGKPAAATPGSPAVTIPPST
ncbi:MAG: PQQ-binding-like beta-propeller repeat protein, partial [Bryobacteraceae bacterium]